MKTTKILKIIVISPIAAITSFWLGQILGKIICYVLIKLGLLDNLYRLMENISLF